MDYPRHALRSKAESGQAIMEFTFAMILVLLLAYALMQIFRWNGVSLAERRIAHENVLIGSVDEGFTATTRGSGPAGQIDPYFYKSKKVKAVWGE